ncbi:MAG: ThuA domain-containing protein [Planctomycetaceae bacterium]|nr:ThuA domain-containing protein [Planctomycetaceae bacterium]
MIFSKQTSALVVSSCLITILNLASVAPCAAADGETKLATPQSPRRVLLLWQGPDGHKPTTHEFEAGIRLIGNMLQRHTNYQVMLSKADENWERGPELLQQADTTVLFITQGSRWIQQTPERLQLFQEYAQRGGGLVAIHWAIGAKADEYIPAFLPLLGATHGGSDRKYAFLKTEFRPAQINHPIQNGLRPLQVEDEFYYNLKQVQSSTPVVPVMESKIEGEWYMTSWAWERPDGGRSFGFSGLHYHGNWREEVYRRLIVQGILWTLKEEIPRDGVDVSINEEWLKLPVLAEN